MNRTNKSLSAPTIAAVTALVPGVAAASAFQILEQSPSRLGTAFAGTASAADDATTVFFNPAGMARLEDSRFTVGGNLIFPEADFEDEGSTTSAGTALSGPEDETDDVGFVPNLYYTRPLTERWTLGVGVNVPFGLTTDYDDDWKGRYHATDSELVLANVNPTFAYAVNDRLSLGIGVNYQHIDATLENEVDSFAACTEAPGASPAACSSAALGTPLAPATRAQDSSAEFEADDDDFTLDLSLLFEISERTRVGATYRQGGDFTLDGDADIDQSTACATNAGCSAVLTTLDGDIEADLDMPDTLNLSVTHAIDDRWTVHGDVAYTEWDSIQEVEVVNTENGTTVRELVLEYDDTVRYAAGATRAGPGPWTWRFGVAFDEAPQTDPALQTPRVPDEDRTWIAFGFNYDFANAGSLDFGYAHLFMDDIDIDNTDDSSGNTLTGEFDADVDIVGVQYNWRF